MKWILLCCLSVCILYAKAQNITKAEFFFDADPGPGKGTPVAVNTPGTTVSLSFPAPTTGLSAGFHSLNVRTRMDDSSWGHYESRSLFISSSTTNTGNITAAEFFIDTDPGPGLATATSVGISGSTVNFAVSIPTISLTAGFHNISIRTKNAQGVWSLYESRAIFISSGTSNVGDITTAEFFVDADPGAGSGTPLSVTKVGSVFKMVGTVPTTTLSAGFHSLSVRTRNSSGNWGLYETRAFFVSSSTTNVTSINKAEFFIDTDPGPGLGTNMSVGVAGRTVNFTSPPIALTNLQPGFHTLCVRTRDVDRKWGHYESRVFFISGNVANSPNITAAESFVDADPGPGLGTPANVGTNGTTVNFSVTIPTASFTQGFHTLSIRTKGADGKWGHFETRGFFVTAAANNLSNIVAGEFFLDVDPGVGNGFPLPITTPAATVNEGFICDIPVNTPSGDHMLFIRVQNLDGHWSHWDSVLVTVDGLQSPSSITCTPTNLTPCRSSTFNVNFSTTGLFGVARNVFTAQLSDANGSFANPTIIGTKNSLPSGVNTPNSISVTIPANTPNGINYRIRILSSAPAFSGDTSVAIKIETPDKPIITANRPIVFCEGDSVVLTSSAASSFLWSNGATTQSITVKASGRFSLTVFNAAGCVSSAADSVTVTVNALPTKPTISANRPTTFCLGDSVVLTSNPTTNIRWNTGATTASITVKSGTRFAVTSTNANGCQNTSDSTRVTVNPLPPVPTIAASKPIPVIFCDGDSVTLTANTSGGLLWSNGATSTSIKVKTVGNFNFSVTQTNGNGCKSTSLPTAVTVNALPAIPLIAANRPTIFCNGDSTVLTANTNVGLLWSNGANTQSITVKTGGNFSVTTTNDKGCKATSANTLITVNPVPATPTITRSQAFNVICQGDSLTLTSSANSGNTWSNGDTTKSIVVKTAGAFSVRVTNSFGCTSRSSSVFNITVSLPPPTATISITGPRTFCQGDSVTLTSNFSTLNLWSTSETTQRIVVKTSGSFTVSRVGSNGCKSTSLPVLITVNPLPPVPNITPNGPITFCNGDSVLLTSSAAAGNLWSNNDTTQSISVKASGNFLVTATDVNGCKATSLPTAIVVNPIPSTPAISITGNSTFCTGDSVTLTSSATTGNIWSNGRTTRTNMVRASGVFTVSVNLLGCSSAPSTPVQVTVNPIPPTPTIAITGNTTFCQGDSVTLTSSAAAGNIWSNGQVTQSIKIRNTETVTVSVTLLGCSSAPSNPVVITVNPVPPTPTVAISGNTTFCQRDSVTLTSSSIADNVWLNGQTTRSITVKTSASLSVRVVSFGCSSAASAVVNVTANAVPPVPVISTNNRPTTFCQGDSVILTSSQPNNNLWSNGERTSSITVKNSGSFSVTRTNASGCSATSAPTVVTVNPIPATPTITVVGNTTFCQGDSVILISSAAAGNEWSTENVTQSIKVTFSGTFTVTASALGCTSAPSAAVNVVVNPKPATPTISASGPTTFCNGDSVTLTSSATSGNVWSTGETTQSITLKSNAIITVSATSPFGCTSDPSLPTTVTVNNIPAVPSIAASGNTTFCQGDSVTLTSSATSGNIWSNGATTQSIIVKTTGTFSVIASALGCSSAASVPVSVVVNPIPATPTVTASGPTTFCSGSSVTLTSSATSGNVWSIGAVTNTLRVTTSGSFSVRTTALGCTSLASIPVVVTVNSTPTRPTITANGPTAFCQGDSVSLTCNVSTGIQWSTGETTRVIIVKAEGTYTVTRTSSNGCSNTSFFIHVKVNPLPATPTISPSGTQSICQGDSLVLTSSPAFAYLWDTGAITQSITTFVGGTFALRVRDANGCISLRSAPTTVLVKPLPTVNAITGTANVCIGSTRQLSNTTPGGVWVSSATNVATVSSTGLVTGLSKGTVTIRYTVIGTNGCGRTVSFSMVVNSLPTVTPILGNTSICQGSTTNLSNTTLGGVWSSSKPSVATISSTGVVQGLSKGTATITYTVGPNANGCTNKSTITFTVNGLPSVGTITGNTTVCVGRTTQLSNTTLLGSWSSSNGNATVNQSTGLVTGVQIGTSTITYRTVTNIFGCTNSTSATVSIIAPCFSVAKANLIEPIVVEPMQVSIFPNPTGDVFNVQVKAPKQESITIRVLDVIGKIAYQAKGMPNQTFHFGELLKAGTYLVEVRQGDEVKTLKAVKVRQ